jgi:hypothetical protein
MKIETTIEEPYVDHWGAKEGIREVVQNGKDAETEFGAKLVVRWKGDVLRVENTGCTLDKSAILMGRSSKRDRADMIGKWGEGLPIGCLAIVRAGYEVRIRTGSEVWVPRIEESDKFDGARVLVFEILTGRKHRDRVCVEVHGVDKEEWETIRSRFLFLAKPKKGEIVETDNGDLLLASRYRGQLFIKGVFVQFDDSLTHGYNYRNADYDRDRRMVEDFDKRTNNRRIWEEAVARRPELFKIYYNLLDAGARDLAGVTQYSAPYMRREALEGVAEAFIEEHGEDAVPCENLGECQDLEHLGRKGVITPEPLRVIVSRKIGSVEAVKAELKREVVKTYSWHELDGTERTHLTGAIELIAAVTECSLEDVDVVDFRSETLQGQFKDGRIAIAKRDLADRDLTLEILVHEVAHHAGTDGAKSHVATIEGFWSQIVGALRNQLSEPEDS